MSVRITVEITEDALAHARREYPSGCPRNTPETWSTLQLQNALSMLSATSGFTIVGVEAAITNGEILDAAAEILSHNSFTDDMEDRIIAAVQTLGRAKNQIGWPDAEYEALVD